MDATYWFLFPIAIVISALANGAGVGGATFFSPLFVLVLGLDTNVAVGAALITEVFGFSSGVHVGEWNKPLKPVALVRKPAYPQQAVEWSRGLKDMFDAQKENRPHRASLEHAVHVVEIINAVSRSAAQNGAPIELKSTFDRPAPFPWAG